MERRPSFKNLHSEMREFEHTGENSAWPPDMEPLSHSRHAHSVPRSPIHKGAIPKTAILADILKTFEVQLIRKGLLKPPPDAGVNPIWFLAETERNVFLWRNGHSISDMHRFEFWIDIPALIDKRMLQLENRDYENPFMNPLWGGCEWHESNHHENFTLQAISKRELGYLSDFMSAFSKIHSHAHALSFAGTMVLKELGERQRHNVVLPIRPGEK